MTRAKPKQRKRKGASTDEDLDQMHRMLVIAHLLLRNVSSTVKIGGKTAAQLRAFNDDFTERRRMSKRKGAGKK